MEEKELIDSHILPNKTFFGDMLAKEGPKRLIPTSNDVNEPLPRKPMQSGPKEPLLCFHCDSVRLGRLDKYFTEFYRKGTESRGVDDPRWIQVTAVDYVKMRLAQLSFLWRMAVSSQPQFRHASLPDEDRERIRRMLLADDPGVPDFYPCVWMHPGNLTDVLRHGVILSPLNGGESLRMFATGLVWLWFLSAREDNPLAEASIQPAGRMLILKAGKDLVDDFGSEVQGLIKIMERKPNAEKLDRWGWNDTRLQ